ncbi:CvpA family protein [Gemmobacter serpentinus]|uniref:CvpA family protein n=1 Tax=Gemmobacter serpentinus TaxID=2652247 RepID=UPI00124E98A9|nr:CvpA family protein [Gemmobacter serpentinus]
MEGFTIIDGVVAAVIVLSAILAYSRGLIRESMAIAGWVCAAILAYVFAAQAQPLVKEIPGLNKLIGDSCELSIIVAFAAVFALGLVLAALFTPLLSSWVNQSVLGGLDQALGFLFGVARGVLLVAVAFIVYDRALPGQTVPMVDNSRSAKVFSTFQGNLDNQIPSDAPGWILEKYMGLVSVCAAPTDGSAPLETAPQGTAPAQNG